MYSLNAKYTAKFTLKKNMPMRCCQKQIRACEDAVEILLFRDAFVPSS